MSYTIPQIPTTKTARSAADLFEGWDSNLGQSYKISGTNLFKAASGESIALSNNGGTGLLTVADDGTITQTVPTGTAWTVNGSNSSSLSVSTNGTITLAAASARSTLVKPAGDSTAAFQVQPSGSATPTFNVDTTNGRVGIGIAAPSQLLDIVGAASAATQVRFHGGSQVRFVAFHDNSTDACAEIELLPLSGTTGVLIGVAKGASKPISGLTDGDSYIFTRGSSSTKLQIGDSSKTTPTLTVDAVAQKVGILNQTSFGTNNRLVVNAYNTVDNNAIAIISNNSVAGTGLKPLVLQGTAGQIGNVLEAQASTGVLYWVVGSDASVGTRLYNTYTDGSNGEWFEVSWSSNVCTLKATKNGTGTLRGLDIGGATTDKIGFYGVTAVVQPATVGTATGYTAGATGATFHSDDTYTGNTGSTAYTINGVVNCLKTLGLIAA